MMVLLARRAVKTERKAAGPWLHRLGLAAPFVL